MHLCYFAEKDYYSNHHALNPFSLDQPAVYTFPQKTLAGQLIVISYKCLDLI